MVEARYGQPVLYSDFRGKHEFIGAVDGDGTHPGVFTEVFWAALHGLVPLTRSGRLLPEEAGLPNGSPSSDTTSRAIAVQPVAAPTPWAATGWTCQAGNTALSQLSAVSERSSAWRFSAGPALPVSVRSAASMTRLV